MDNCSFNYLPNQLLCLLVGSSDSCFSELLGYLVSIAYDLSSLTGIKTKDHLSSAGCLW